MKRTTVLADEELLLEAKQLAARNGKTLTDVIREALTQYVATHRTNRRLPFVGMGDSGNPRLAHQTEDILAAEGDPIYGWTRQASSRPQSAATDPDAT